MHSFDARDEFYALFWRKANLLIAAMELDAVEIDVDDVAVSQANFTRGIGFALSLHRVQSARETRTWAQRALRRR